ncbi:MAG: hypothetical protein LVQ75_00380 [Candidatus Babeliales bacterium]|jgi:hypothetical protein
MFNRFLLILVLSFSNLSPKDLGTKGLGEIADLPHAQKFITDVLKARNVDPDNLYFSFEKEGFIEWWFGLRKEYFDINMSCSCHYNDMNNKIEQVLYIRKKDLEIVNIIMTYQANKSENELSCQALQFKRTMQFVLGHELQHYFDHADPSIRGSDEALKNFWSNLSNKRENEIKADKCASLDPKLLRTGAEFFQENYSREKSYYNALYKNPHQKIDVHPHPLERAKYLLVAANAQEVINKKFDAAFSCLIKKRKEKKHKEAIINGNLADIEKIVG